MTHDFLGWPDWNFPFNIVEVKKSETINGWQNATGFFWALLSRAMFVFFFFYKWAGPVENSHSGPQVSDHWLNDPPLLWIVRLSGLNSLAHLDVFAQAAMTHFLENVICPPSPNLNGYNRAHLNLKACWSSWVSRRAWSERDTCKKTPSTPVHSRKTNPNLSYLP